MKVAIISLHQGGMYHYAAMMARSLLAADPTVQVALFLCEAGGGLDWAAGCRIFSYPVPQTLQAAPWRYFLLWPLVMRRLHRDLRAWNPDVIHVNSGHLWYAPLVAGWAGRTPLVCTLHDVAIHPGESRLYERMKLAPLLRHSRRIVLHSQALKDQALLKWRLSSDRAVVMPCGLLESLDVRRPAVEENPFGLLFFGRMYAYKGLDVLLAALEWIIQEAPSVRLTIAGSGNLSPWMPAIQRWGSHIRVLNRFISEDETAGVFQESALVILPYIEASQSGVAMMAAAFGKPVVASRVGAISEAVTDGVTGVLVPPRDPAALARAILQLLRDADVRQRMGRKARERGEQVFGPRPIGDALMALYRSVWGESGRGSEE